MKKVLVLLTAIILAISTASAINLGDLFSFGGEPSTSQVSEPGLLSGEYLIVDIHTSEASNSFDSVKGFTIRENFPDDSSFENEGNSAPLLMIRDRKSGKNGKYRTHQGNIMSTDGSLSQLSTAIASSPCLTDNCNGNLNHIFTKSFSEDFHNECGQGNFDCKINENPRVSGILGYKPQGEIIVGAARGDLNDYEDPKLFDNTKFHLCNNQRYEATSEDRVVYTAEDGYTGYECQLNGEWSSLPECKDGIDNDDNGRLDHQNSKFTSTTNNDPGCDSLTDEEKSSETSCNRIIQNEDFEKVFQAGVMEDGSCDYSNEAGFSIKYTDSNEIQEPNTANEGFPHVFECKPGFNDHLEYEKRKQFCNSLPLTSSYWGPHETMKVAAYKVPENQIPTSSESQIVNNYVENPESSLLAYFDSVKYQTLKSAEFSYTGSGHHGTSYYGENNFVTGGDMYESGEMDEEWQVANAGAPKDNSEYEGSISSAEGTIDNPAVFRGGFAGNCVTGTSWTYVDGEWLCGTEESEKETMNIKFFNIVPDQTEGYAGFFVPLSSLDIWLSTHPETPTGGEFADPVSIRAQCWRGTPAQRPSDSSKRVNLERKPPTTTIDDNTFYPYGIGVVGKLPERPTLANPNQYTCMYGFQQAVKPFENPPAANVKLYHEGEIFWNEDTNSGHVGSFEPETTTAYITEGVNEHDASKIETKIQTVSQIRDNPVNTSWLKQQAQRTNTLNVDPFKHFNTGNPANGIGSRHPLEGIDQDYDSWDFGSNGR
ncbi:MAG: hypothetical protein H8Z69_00970 [Nanohaloarchaea archaeon]|nr:hypothetical protein [Candidatus Nanohaloarchaea archaeon]